VDIIVLSTSQNSSDNLSSYPRDSHHCSDVFCWRGSTSFTDRLSIKCILKQLWKIPPHLIHVTTLHCQKTSGKLINSKSHGSVTSALMPLMCGGIFS